MWKSLIGCLSNLKHLYLTHETIYLHLLFLCICKTLCVGRCVFRFSFISTAVAVWSPAGLWPLVMLPCREDDDCSNCSVWSVTGQNRPSSKSLFVSLPLTSLSLHTTSICIFIATCLPVLLSDQVLLRSRNADFRQQTHLIQEIKSIYLSIPWERTSRGLFEYVAQKAPELEVWVWCIRASVFSENQNGITAGLCAAEC